MVYKRVAVLAVVAGGERIAFTGISGAAGVHGFRMHKRFPHA